MLSAPWMRMKWSERAWQSVVLPLSVHSRLLRPLQSGNFTRRRRRRSVSRLCALSQVSLQREFFFLLLPLLFFFFFFADMRLGTGHGSPALFIFFFLLLLLFVMD